MSIYWRIPQMKLVRAFSLSLLALLVVSSLGLPKADFSKKEGKPCTFCHPPGKFKDLTDAGKYYKEHNYSLVGYKSGAENR